MIKPTTPTEEMMYCTARIVGTNAAGQEIKTGTAFFYQFPVATGDNRIAPVLITNKHVIDGASHANFVIHTHSTGADRPDGQKQITSNIADWIPHPNPKVDLRALPIGGTLTQTQAFYRAFDPAIIPSEQQLDDLSAVEEILMVGYPNGLWDSINNYPLIRRGITASHPAIDFDVDGVPTTVVDMACFPGSSGSPIVLHNFGTYTAKGGGTVIGSRTMLLGILFSGPQIQTDGKIVIRNIPTATEPLAKINLMMNLGYIIKSRELAALSTAILQKIGPIPPAK